jgi:hypothetical protein
MFKAEEALIAAHFLEGVTVIGDIRHEQRTDSKLLKIIHVNFLAFEAQ